MPAALKTFIIYSAADRELRIALERQLKSLIDNGLVNLWSDKEILPGEQWDSAIKKQLLDAELFLMLISADFFNSDYIREKEFVAALAKLERGEAIIIPIIGRDCDWEAYPEIKKLQVLPPGGIAVTDIDYWKTPDKAWATVTRQIRRSIEARDAKREEQKQIETLEKQRIEDEKAAEAASQKLIEKRFAEDIENQKQAETARLAEIEKTARDHEESERIQGQKKQQAELRRQQKLAEKRRTDEETALRGSEKNENDRRAAAARLAEKQVHLGNAKPFPTRLTFQIGGMVLGMILMWFLGKKIFQKNQNQKPENKTEQPQVTDNQSSNAQTEPAPDDRLVGSKTIDPNKFPENVGVKKGEPIGKTDSRPDKENENPSPPILQNPGAGRSKSGFQMKNVPGGTFTMGSPATEKDRDDDECQHQVLVSSFKIGIYEVTQADWYEIMGTHPSNFKNCDGCSVEQVSWNDTQDFLKKLNARTGRNYRLPTENEWEFAARGGISSNGYLFAGGNALTNVAWCDSNSGSKTHEVGTKTPNELGIFDMSGNVWEWCKDVYKPYPCDSKNKGNPTVRVVRGGSLFHYKYARSAERSTFVPSVRNGYYGFRLAQD